MFLKCYLPLDPPVCFLFWPCHMVSKIIVLQPGIESMPPTALEAQSLNHWTTREVRLWGDLNICLLGFKLMWEKCLYRPGMLYKVNKQWTAG